MDLFEVLSHFIPLSSSFSAALDPKYSYIILPYGACEPRRARSVRASWRTHFNDPTLWTPTENDLVCFQKLLFFIEYLDTRLGILPPQWRTSWIFSDILSPLLCHFSHRRAEIIPSGICLITSKTSGNPAICWSDHRLSAHPSDSQVGCLAVTDRFNCCFWGPRFASLLLLGTNVRKVAACVPHWGCTRACYKWKYALGEEGRHKKKVQLHSEQTVASRNIS